MDLRLTCSKDLAIRLRVARLRALRLQSRDEVASAHVAEYEDILAEFRRRKEWPGDLRLEATSDGDFVCDACGDEIPEGAECVEVAGGETGPGAIGYYTRVCMACDAFERKVG